MAFKYETDGRCSRVPADSVESVKSTVIATPILPQHLSCNPPGINNHTFHEFLWEPNTHPTEHKSKRSWHVCLSLTVFCEEEEESIERYRCGIQHLA